MGAYVHVCTRQCVYTRVCCYWDSPKLPSACSVMLRQSESSLALMSGSVTVRSDTVTTRHTKYTFIQTSLLGIIYKRFMQQNMHTFMAESPPSPMHSTYNCPNIY